MSFRGKKAGHFGGPKHAFIDSKGCPGVLVLCMQGKEEQALREATALFSDYTRRVYPALFPSLESAAAAADAGAAATEAPRGDGNASGAAGSTTVADEIAAELAELAGERVGASSGVKRRREGDASVAGADCGAEAVAPPHGVAALASTPVPIRTAMVCRAMGILWFPGVAGASIDPCVVVNALCADLLATRQQCSRFIDRLVPLQRIVRSDMEEVLAATRDLLGADIAVAAPEQAAAVDGSGSAPTAEPSVAAPPRTWCAEVRVRNTDMVSKSLLTSGLGDIMRRRFRVDLEGGSHTIIVEACMSIAGVSVAREASFWRFSRYNGECIRIERDVEVVCSCCMRVQCAYWRRQTQSGRHASTQPR